jgi:hypothetical protein
MSVPAAVFLDTSILAAQQYNFASTALTTFVAAAKARGVQLLLPDPTEREIKRQIRERSNAALQALNEARRRAPFLAKWSHFPKKTLPSDVDWEVSHVANAEWRQFLAQFHVIRLDYGGLDVAKVMVWYDNVRPPFREGKKRKEFPDAFAIALLEAYATAQKCSVAVVSEDQDFRLACDLAPSLLYFPNLPRLTELLVLDEAQMAELRASVLADVSLVVKHLEDKATELSYYHYDRQYTLLDSDFAGASLKDIRIVAIGNQECTLAFEAEVEAEHRLRWEEQAYDDQFEQVTESVLETASINGTAKVMLDPKAQRISAVTYLELDGNEIEVTENPRHRW